MPQVLVYRSGELLLSVTFQQILEEKETGFTVVQRARNIPHLENLGTQHPLLFSGVMRVEADQSI